MTPLIHIVDDDASFRKLLAQLLQASAYEVALYDSAEQVLQLPLDARPGCILLDVRMPGLSGPELQDRLVQFGSPLPIIFPGGHANIPTTVRAIKAGAEDFLSKPIAKKVLFDAIGRALKHCQATLEQREHINVLQARVGKLTPRQRKVFELVARPDQQPDSLRAWNHRANHQGASAEGHAVAECSLAAGACRHR